MDTKESEQLWVLLGRLDLPVFLPPRRDESGKEHKAKRIMLDFSGGDGDGYIELRPEDVEKTSQESWWSEDERIIFHFRASISAPNVLLAVAKSSDFLEQALDRITLIAGTPATLLSRDLLYNESQLEACRAGRRDAVDATTTGRLTYRTRPIQNPHLVPFLRPSEGTKMGLRWFRKSLTAANPEDRFLGFYIALEAVSDDVRAPKETLLMCPHCGKEVRRQTMHSEGIKQLIEERELPTETFHALRKARGRVAHGGSGVSRLKEADQFVPLAQQLAQDGIARSLGVDPNTVRMIPASPPDVGPLLEIPYDPMNNPHTAWGSSIRESITKSLKAQGKNREGED